MPGSKPGFGLRIERTRGLDTMIAHPFAYIFPLLLAATLIQKILKTFYARLGLLTKPIIATLQAIALSAALIFIPIKGIPLAGWVLGINANFSIPLTALLFGKLWQNATGVVLLDRHARQTAWIFGLFAGLALYPSVLGFGPAKALDPYGLGYGSTLCPLLLLALTVALLITRNRFGVVLVAAVFAYDFQLLESPNFWDYLVDPVFAILSLAVLVYELFGRAALCFVWKGSKGSAECANVQQ